MSVGILERCQIHVLGMLSNEPMYLEIFIYSESLPVEVFRRIIFSTVIFLSKE